MKTIKNILKSKITYAVLACLLLVGIFAGISTLAEDVQPTLTITGKNINHAENASIVYQVKVDNLSTEVQAQDRFTMKFWAEAPKSAAEPAGAVVKPYLYTDNADGSFNVHFESIGFAPKDMTTAVYAAACYTDATGKETYSNITRYSVYEYLCEANRNVDKTNEQANLYSAMKDYITYAQKYLGYTEATTPDCIGYVTVHYGYITIDGDPSGARFTSLAVPVGMAYTMHYDFAGLPYRLETGYTYSDITKPVNTGYNGMAKGDLDRTFTISKIVSFNVPAIENTQIVELRPNTLRPHNGKMNIDGTYPQMLHDGNIALETLNATPNTEAGTYVVTERFDSFKNGAQNGGANDYHIWGIAANPYNEAGLPFSHWALPDGTFYSDDIALIFNEFAEVKSKNPDDPTTVNFNAVPVYAAADQSLKEFGITGGNDKNKLVDPTANGFTYDASAKTASGNSYVQAKGTLPKTTQIDRVVCSFNLLVNKHADHDSLTGDARKLLYGLNTGTAFNEISLGYNGTAQVPFEYLLNPADDWSKCTFTMRGDKTTVNFNTGDCNYFAIGDEVQVTVVAEYLPMNGGYTLERSHLYIDGVYVGFATVHKQITQVFVYNGAVTINYLSNLNNKSKITYSNIQYHEFVSEE